MATKHQRHHCKSRDQHEIKYETDFVSSNPKRKRVEDPNANYDIKIEKANIILNKWKDLLMNRCQRIYKSQFSDRFEIDSSGRSIILSIYPFVGSYTHSLSINKGMYLILCDGNENDKNICWDMNIYMKQDDAEFKPIYFVGNLRDMLLDWKDMCVLANWGVHFVFNALCDCGNYIDIAPEYVIHSKDIISHDAQRFLHYRYHTRGGYATYCSFEWNDWSPESYPPVDMTDIFTKGIEKWNRSVQYLKRSADVAQGILTDMILYSPQKN